MKNYKREKVIASLRLVWTSLESHLGECIELTEGKECCRKAIGSPSFHRQCIREYAEIIHTLSEQL